MTELKTKTILIDGESVEIRQLYAFEYLDHMDEIKKTPEEDANRTAFELVRKVCCKNGEEFKHSFLGTLETYREILSFTIKGVPDLKEGKKESP